MPYTDQITEITPYVRISAFPSDLSTMGHLLKPQIINVYQQFDFSSRIIAFLDEDAKKKEEEEAASEDPVQFLMSLVNKAETLKVQYIYV